MGVKNIGMVVRHSEFFVYGFRKKMKRKINRKNASMKRKARNKNEKSKYPPIISLISNAHRRHLILIF